MIKKAWFLSLFFVSIISLYSQESWLIPVDSPLYREAEEIFINAGVVPPYEELPLAAEDLKSQLQNIVENTDILEQVQEIKAFNERIKLPFPVFSPLVEMGLSAGINTETGRFQYIPLKDGGLTTNDPDNGRKEVNYTPYYDAASVPSILKVGFIMQFSGFSLLFAPELRQCYYGLLQDNTILSVPTKLEYFDINNTPLVGIANFYSPNFEVRLGRDKLHSGPGKYSSLSLSRTMPYFDHVRVRLRTTGISISSTVVTLNPVISRMESDYLDALYASGTNPEPTGSANGKIYNDRIKNYINTNVVIRPWPWLSVSIMQTNLVGGRPLQIKDFNPLIIFHNNYEDGSYSVPLIISTTVVPVKGVKIYAEFMLYDLAAGDELSAPNTTPGAIGLMGGFSLISTPYFEAGPGRFRLDFEAAYVDPYAYGKYYDLRKFTSRFMYLDRGAGRYWVDYPLGFYLGPDCLDFHASLSYGIPGAWEAELEWQTTGKGEMDMYGYGDDSKYTNKTARGPAPTGTAEWTNSFRLSFFFKATADISVTLWYQLEFVNNRFDAQTRSNIPGDNAIFHYAGAAATWKIF
jgi:hypothetical protein